MVVVESNCLVPNNTKDILETPTEMGKDEISKIVEDVEEGEISDSASLEEISEEDFNKQDAIKASNGSDLMDSKPKGGDTRVWTMRDLYNYPGFRGYTSGLYNLAWAHAVQNKPLNDIFVMDVDSEDHAKRSSCSASINSGKEDKNNVKEVDSVLIVDSGDEVDPTEKEEGELEEGEIDLDSEHLENNAHDAKGGAFNSGAMDVGNSGTDLKGNKLHNRVNLDSEHLENNAHEAKGGAFNSDAMDVGNSGIDLKGNELHNRVNAIREALESVTVMDAEKSLEEVCSRLHNTLESLQGVIMKISLTTMFDIRQLFFNAIRAVNSVFCSMNQNKKEQKKETFLRLLSSIKNSYSHILSPKTELMNEIDVIISSVNSLDVLPTTRATHKEEGARNFDGFHEKDSNSAAENVSHAFSFSKLPSKSVPAVSMVHSNPISSSENLKTGISGSKSRGILLPLLDLHKDHDADSLPSPTRESSSCFSVLKIFAARDGIVESGSTTAKEVLDREASRPQRYETDAFKALSTYQQKFGRNSFLTIDKLPSPTPSEEFDDGGDPNVEVSSSCVDGNLRAETAPVLGRPLVFSSIPVSSSSMQGHIISKTVALPTSCSTPTMKASAKSRDPRLKVANLDSGGLDHNQRPFPVTNNTSKVEPIDQMSSRKKKAVENSNLDGPELKRQRSRLGHSDVIYDVKTAGRLNDSDLHGHQLMNKNPFTENAEGDPRRPINVANCPATSAPNIGNNMGTVTSTSSTASLPALLKDIAVNPTMLLNLIKLGQQQKSVADSQQMSADPAKCMVHPSDTNSILAVAPLASATTPKASGILQTPAGALQVNSQVVSMISQDDLGKIRMKPRDPRRILHSNILQKSGNVGNEQSKTSVLTVSSKEQRSKDNINGKKHEVQADNIPLTSQSGFGPDIARQFTKNLRNIADLMSVSSTLTSSAIVPLNVSCQQLAIKADRGDQKAIVSKSEDQRSRSSSASEAAVVGLSCSPNIWSDVEHLFEGYSDHQKAAIQRERARRLEEQNKMFAARKLCLVLDLDHTLLNSAKFVEVDPMHDEILRKKEEQDREKPYKHLFRFPHMGMWTKLRPGIWNFLEKASKLFELHLYTMGNKVYATEMAKVLDPNGVLFAGRVISRGDEGDPSDGDDRAPKSKDLEGVLGMESSVVIIDDSVRVWPHNKMNLIVVERYMYFPCSRRQFGLQGPSLLEIDHDERPEDGTLASCLGVIERMHQNFFSHHLLDEADVRNILAEEQRKILSGCRIVFSRVFPVDEVKPHLHPLWQTAEQFGAVCTSHIDEQVTHVVANSLGTDKVNWALSSGKFVVHPSWVEASALLYRRVNEQDFAIKS